MSSSVRQKMAEVIKAAKHSPAITPEVKNEAKQTVAETPKIKESSKPAVKKTAKNKAKIFKKV
jgi:hypothetical protein|tara:strand:- start:486 stop:674 length:189 start_codon:yes stop_codon:yes gene_type:complete